MRRRPPWFVVNHPLVDDQQMLQGLFETAASLAAADIATAQRPRVAGLEPSASEGHADAEDELAATAEASTGAGAARRTGRARAT